MKKRFALILAILLLLPLLGVQAEKNTLRIVNANFALSKQRLNDTVAQFQKMYPDTEIVLVNMNDTQLAADFLSRGGDIDILCVNRMASLIGLDDMVRAGCLEDLSAYSSLTEKKKSWINLDGLGVRGGKWVAVPVAVEAVIWRVNTALAEKLDITIPENWTWEDFFALGQQVKERSGGSAYLMAIAPGSEQYPRDVLMANCVDVERGEAAFECEDGLRMLEIWQQCLDKGYVKMKDILLPDAFTGEFPDENALLFAGDAVKIPRLGGAKCVLPPVQGTLSHYPTPLYSFVVSNNAKNKEAAIRFLEIYMSAEVQGNDSYLATCPLLKERAAYRPETAFSSEWQAMMPTEENHQLWVKYLENSMEDRSLGGIDDIRRYQAMCRGENTPEEYLAAIQNYAAMVLGE